MARRPHPAPRTTARRRPRPLLSLAYRRLLARPVPDSVARGRLAAYRGRPWAELLAGELVHAFLRAARSKPQAALGLLEHLAVRTEGRVGAAAETAAPLHITFVGALPVPGATRGDGG